MIERLINLEHPLEKPEYDRLSEQVIQLKRQFADQLEPDGNTKLEQLSEMYLNQGSILVQNAFFDGFCTAVSLMLDYLDWYTSMEHPPIANRQRPPKP